MDREQKYNLLVKWMGIPHESKIAQGLPLNNQEFMEQYKITHEEFVEFFEHENFPDDVEREAIRWGKRKVPELIHTVYKQYLETKRPEHLRLFKELLTVSGAKEQNNQFNFFNLNENAKKELIERTTRKFQERGTGLLPSGGRE